MQPSHVTTIAIVGAGFSGVATTLNLMGNPQAFKIYLIDDESAFGKGLAYGTEDDNLVLNVPCGNMSVYADRPDDFLEYCRELDSSLNSGSFIFRRVYGEYLQSRLSEAKSARPEALVEVKDCVQKLSHDHKFTLTLSSGDTLQVDQVVLAFGHFSPRNLTEMFSMPARLPDKIKAALIDNPWDIDLIDRLPKDRDVLIVGTGHTAVDTVFRLVSAPASRKIYLVSRHGHIPNGHRKSGEFVKLPALTKKIEQVIRNSLVQTPTIRSLLATIRQLSDLHHEDQGNWRDVINSLRPITPEIWKTLSVKERARFLRHLVHHWDVLRHRLAPVAIQRFQTLLSSGRVELIAGRIRRIDADLQVKIQLRGSKPERVLQVGSIVNCTGPNYDITRVDNALVRQLVDVGMLQQDEMKIGFSVDENYRCSKLPAIYYIGPMLKARYWEAIAVPELRVHARNLVQILLAE